MPAYFVAGTGTGIGKTFVTTALCQQLKEQRKNVFAIKPVITGWTDDKNTNDTLLILDSLSIAPTKENIKTISPWQFATPMAANLAAKKEGRMIVFEEVVDFCQATLHKHMRGVNDYILIEGVGGIMSPLTNDKTFLDLIEAVGIPVILVCGSYLGSISHTLTAVEALTCHNVPIKHIIISESEDSNTSLADTSETLTHLLQRQIVYLPRLMQPEARFWTALLDMVKILDS